MKGDRMLTITIRIPAVLNEAIRTEAKRRGMSYGAYLRFLAERDMADGMRVDAAVSRVLQELIDTGQVHGGNGAVRIHPGITHAQGGASDE